MVFDNKRPVIKLPYTKNEIALEIVTAMLLIVSINQIMVLWPKIPGTVPTHFNFAGQADDWGPKSSMIALPIVSAIMYLLLSLPRRFPHIGNYIVPITPENAERQYKLLAEMMAWIKFEIIALFFYLEQMTINVALGKTNTFGPWLGMTFVPLTFITLGIYIYLSYKAK